MNENTQFGELQLAFFRSFEALPFHKDMADLMSQKNKPEISRLINQFRVNKPEYRQLALTWLQNKKAMVQSEPDFVQRVPLDYKDLPFKGEDHCLEPKTEFIEPFPVLSKEDHEYINTLSGTFVPAKDKRNPLDDHRQINFGENYPDFIAFIDREWDRVKDAGYISGTCGWYVTIFKP
jgi:hypothetical protein